MSYIDIFRHELVGNFGCIPVYHPLEDIAGSDDPNWDGDFSCTSDQLVLGGGGGEWPGLVLKKPASAVADFLAAEFEDWQTRPGWKAALDGHLFEKHVLHFVSWDTEQHALFLEICKSTALPNPFGVATDDLSFEDWLRLGFGEFVLFCMPELAADLLGKIDVPRDELKHMRYNNIMAVPPGLPTYANAGNMWEAVRRNPPK